MSRIHLDAYSVVSGDMLLGALLDVGASLPNVQAALATLPVSGWNLELQTVTRHGISGKQARVALSEAPQPRRTLSDIEKILSESALPDRVRENTAGVFERLAAAEAKVHGTVVSEVHFHEVGAVDAIVDIVGCCAALHDLGCATLTCSPLPLGTCFVRAAHGMLPVPAPATLELLTSCGAPVLSGAGQGEMVTPTGAALVAHFATFEPLEAVTPLRVGYGFGTRDLPWPNALRALLLAGQDGDSGLDRDTVSLIECNIDDMSGEVVPYVIERLLEAGALDSWATPVHMKKGRPGIVLSTLAASGQEEHLVAILLRETTTLGVRHTSYGRMKAPRRQERVATPYGEVRVKLKLLEGRVTDAAPEYQDCARLAQEQAVPLRTVYDAALQTARSLLKPHETSE